MPFFVDGLSTIFFAWEIGLTYLRLIQSKVTRVRPSRYIAQIRVYRKSAVRRELCSRKVLSGRSSKTFDRIRPVVSLTNLYVKRPQLRFIQNEPVNSFHLLLLISSDDR